MNYLTHIYFSGANRQRQIGNFIGDAVKGNAYQNYPTNIRNGILLHRKIDDFSDKHPLVKEAVKILKEPFGRYAAVLTDIYFDHFLAAHFKQYAHMSLRRFTWGFYTGAIINYYHLPKRIRQFLWHFILTNRLYRYASKEGIQESLEIMVTYKNLQISPPEAIAFLTAHYDELYGLFLRFLPDLEEMCQKELEK